VRTELTCREMVELMTAYLEDALSADDRARFESHLSVCDGCTNYLEQMRETIRLTGRITEDQLDPVQRDALLAAFRGWATPR
jgi:anti-sigma factor RsiW